MKKCIRCSFVLTLARKVNKPKYHIVIIIILHMIYTPVTLGIGLLHSSLKNIRTIIRPYGYSSWNFPLSSLSLFLSQPSTSF